PRHDPRRRASLDAGLPLRSEEARGVARRLGLPEAAANNTCGGSMATDQRGRMPAGAQL
ncbi:MAG: ABC transporter, substrate-binding protein (cluster 4, leucine/isoleucine/valine/benzoate), partial [uncultured Microvirga sp.]